MRVAIAGYGAEGQTSYRYFIDQGHDVTIVTDRVSPQYPVPDGAQAIISNDAFDQLADFDMVVRTPPMAPHSVKTNGKVWSATNEFFEKCTAQIIGVTGTKGKGTTASLIASILKAAGKKVHLVGNIGVPALEVLPAIQETDIVVYELSSFQLWDIKKSPHVAVVLMIEPDHLDVHKDMDEYVSAKANIRRFQNEDDVCFYFPGNKYSQKIASTEGAEGEAVSFGTPEGNAVYVQQGQFMVQGETICPTDVMRIPGDHNLSNACAAISAARVFGVKNEAVAQGLSAFTGLPHRLKFVREVNGVKYYDDSIATTPGSVIAALRSFSQPKVLILGGHDKGSDYTELIHEVSGSDSMRAVVLMGANADALEATFKEQSKTVQGLNNKTGKSLQEVVVAAAACAEPGDVVILSPAAASFDMFKSYSDRGDQFVAAVETL